MEQTPESQVLADCRTSLRNVFMTSDTVTNGFGQAAVSQTALSLANEIIKSFN
jgi:hypothetical protein